VVLCDRALLVIKAARSAPHQEFIHRIVDETVSAPVTVLCSCEGKIAAGLEAAAAKALESCRSGYSTIR
jgi:hypothetical protein